MGKEKVAIIVLCFDEIVPILQLVKNYQNLYNVTWISTESMGRSRRVLDNTPEQAERIKLFSSLVSPEKSKTAKQETD